MNEKYEKIIHLPHHVSKVREQMAKADRASQFAPYSALSGYDDAVEETARLTDRRIELDEYEKERINSALTSISSSAHDRKAVITYFRPDKYKSGGAYITVKGEVAHIDAVKKEISLIGGYDISINEIIEVTFTED